MHGAVTRVVDQSALDRWCYDVCFIDQSALDMALSRVLDSPIGTGYTDFTDQSVLGYRFQPLLLCLTIQWRTEVSLFPDPTP